MSHHFEVKDAVNYGIDAAIVLYNFRFWLKTELSKYKTRKPGAESPKVHNGYVWTYNSARAMADLMPYYTPNKIQKVLKKLENDGVIICGNFNKMAYDRTKWYTMPEYRIDTIEKPNEGNHSSEMNLPFSEMAEPIPDNKPDNKLTPIVPNGDKEREELFWLIVAEWNKTFPMFKKVRDYNSPRKRRLKQIIKNYPNYKDIQKWKQLFTYITKSQWLMSRDGTSGFQLSYDWVTGEKGFTNIIEGTYHTN